MSNNLIQHLQDYLGANIEKINPNTQAIDDSIKHHRYDLLAQASVPAVLVAFYKYTRSAEGAARIATDNSKENPVDYLLGENKSKAISRVAAYGGVGEAQAEDVMEAVADECVRYIRNELGSTMNAENVQQYFAAQRQSILTRLPEDLQMGELLNDPAMDDSTNKMEGPISSLAHKIEQLFASPGVKKDEV